MKFLILFFFFVSCNQLHDKDKSKYNFEFKDDLSFEEFKITLEQYANEKPYPKIDE